MTRDLAEVEIKVGISLKEIIAAIKELDEEDREFLVENLLAATSQEYLESIKEARGEYKRGEVIRRISMKYRIVYTKRAADDTVTTLC